MLRIVGTGLRRRHSVTLSAVKSDVDLQRLGMKCASPQLIEGVMHIEGTIVIADAGMVAPDDKVRAAEVLANEGVKQRPVELGLAASFSRPGGNVTGIAQLVVAAEQKRLELLRELVPTAKTIAYLVNPAGPNGERQSQDAVAQEHALGVKLSVLRASSEGDFAAAFASIVQDRIGALVIGADPFFFMHRDQLVALSMRHSVPTMYFFREFVTAGGLISYGTKLIDGYRQLGVYTSKVLKGAKPADLPIAQQSEKIELIINLKTAKALGLDLPLSLLTRADELIE
jgi:putative ABC transport system substrate-binding protein